LYRQNNQNKRNLEKIELEDEEGTFITIQVEEKEPEQDSEEDTSSEEYATKADKVTDPQWMPPLLSKLYEGWQFN